jgi:hypothetical protein
MDRIDIALVERGKRAAVVLRGGNEQGIPIKQGRARERGGRSVGPTETSHGAPPFVATSDRYVYAYIKVDGANEKP